MTLTWESCRDAFEVDGSLRDIYVLGTDLGDWQRVLNLLREWRLPMVFDVGHVRTAIPDDVAEMFAGPNDDRGTLKVDLHGIQINSHFFVDYEIEFDVDPREVQDDAALAHLIRFMDGIARRLDKPIILTPENFQERPIITVSPTGPPVYHLASA